MKETIERVSPAHAAVLASIHSATFPVREAWGPDAIGLQLAMPGAFGLLDRRAGMLLGRVAADEAEILTLAVLPQVRRQGIAAGLLAAAQNEARARGANVVFLEVGVSNLAAQALYQKAGFRLAGRRRHYYPDGSDALVMRMAVE